MESRNQDDEQEMTEDAPGVTAEVLKAALCQPPPEFCGEAVQFSMDHPALGCEVALGILEEALAAARADRWEEIGYGPVYAAELLGYHRDARAFDLLAEIAWLPDGSGYDLLGDEISMEMGAILWSACGGCSDRLLSLVDHSATSLFWRNAALAAITIGVCEGVLDREEMLRVVHERLEAMLTDGRTKTTTETYKASWLAETIVSLGVGDSSSLLDHAYEVGLIDGEIIDPRIWHEEAPGTHEDALEYIRRRDGWRYPVDPMRMRKWDCFSSHHVADSVAHQKQKKRAKAKKQNKGRARRKASRKLRKKNRRKK